MKNTIKQFSKSFSLMFVLLCSMTIMAQSKRPAVLQIRGANNYTSHFDTQTKLTTDLINKGLEGQATIEFWAKAAPEPSKTNYSPWSLSNLLTGNDEFTFSVQKERVEVTVGGAVVPIDLEGQDQLFNNQWHHFALVFNTTTSKIRVYVDGIERSLIQYASVNPEYLYMTIAAQDQLFVTEYRAWNRMRSRSEIEEARYRSLFNETQTSLEGFNAQGLVQAYVNDVFDVVTLNNLPALEGTIWKNALKDLQNESVTKEEAFITSSYVGGTKFAELRNDADHPIFELEDILLVASDGNGLDTRISGGRNGVELRWPHIQDAIAYRILRKNAKEQGEPIEIETKSDVANNIVSEYIRFFDQEILPNELYEYTVQVIKEGNVRGNSGQDIGFVFANGEVEGTIQTSTNVPTREALVQAVPVNGSNPGSALELAVGTNPIVINEVEDFRRANYTGMIEFWYKTPETPTADNTIFKLGAAEIHMDQNGINVQLNGSEYIAASRTIERDEDGNVKEGQDENNTGWHHYAFVYGPNGGKIYIDGGIKPTGAETEVTPNETVATSFTVDLSNVASFSFNEAVNQKYQIDEIRIWKGDRTTLDLIRYTNHIIAGSGEKGEELENLMAYYRLDLDDTNRIYNQAPSSRGRLVGTSTSELVHLGAEMQPEITYGTYTDVDGRYEFKSINTGRQGITNSGNSFEYRVSVTKPNHEFMPENRVEDIARELQPRTIQSDFTDVSALPISGKIVYRIPNPSEPAGYDEYPTLIGTGIEVDGVRVPEIGPDSKVTTDVRGTYLVSASPGNHTFRVASQVVNAEDTESNNNTLDRRSLDFDAVSGYAVSKRKLAVANTDGFTWTGFINLDIEADPNIAIPAVQTILHWGDVVLEVRNNNRLHVVIDGVDTSLSVAVTGEQAEYDFFALTIDPANTTIGLLVDNDYQTDVLPSGLAIDEKFYIGAQHTDDLENPQINFSRVNVDILEYRNAVYTTDQLNDVRRGNVIAQDEDNLKLSYTFEHVRGTRALNLVVGTSNENEFLELQGGAFFNEESTSGYRRNYEFKYRGINDRFNPVEDLYDFPVLEPISSLNFENLTRRSFIGNIIVPCDNNVGTWTGKIVRTDIEFPTFEVAISDQDFNANRTIFTINDLLPGQYRVELTNDDTGRKIQSSIVDLRGGNNTFDFQYRNNIEVETTFYQFNLDGLNDADENIGQYIGDQIDPTCGDNYVLNTGNGIFISVEVFERYGENKCPVVNATVDISEKLIIGPLQIHTNSLGKANFATQIGTPLFSGDYLRQLNIAVSHEGRSMNENESAYITGARRGNSDFTLVNPLIGFVLHDPPGDGSTATLERGSTYSHSYGFEEGTDISVGISGGLGFEHQVRMSTEAITAPLGVGVATGVSVTTAGVTIDPSLGTTGNFSYRNTGGNGYSTSLSQSISTPGFDDYVGQDADVYIGTSNVLTFGTGMTLEVTNCNVSVLTDRQIMTADTQTPFVFTQQQLLDEIIPDLQRLAIEKIDEINGTDVTNLTEEQQAQRNSLDLDLTLENLLTPALREDDTIKNYLFQVMRWKDIIAENTETLSANNFMEAPDFSSTTSNLEVVDSDDQDLGEGVNELDEEISFSAGPSITYNLSRQVNSSNGSSTGGSSVTNGGIKIATNGFGVNGTFEATLSVSGLRNNTTNNENASSRVDSFTLTDDDAGDQFNVRIRRDPRYDTPMFLTRAGQSSCPFESGTVPREGVEISVDRTVGYGTGDGSILYRVTLRNTQIAADRTRKTYTVGLNGASNGGDASAQVFLNESPIFEPGTSSPITFTLDENSPTGVQQEITANIRIARGLDAPENISYENIGIRIFSSCEQEGDAYRSYRVDEYEEVGVVPFQEIKLTAHFSGACIEEVIADKPSEDWIVNNTDNDLLDFRFRIPEVADDTAPEGFTVDLEYAIEGNNTPRILESLTLLQLKENLQNDGYITYSANVSALTNGTYSFRVTPVCDDGGAGIPSSRQNPTPFVEGTIIRDAPTIVRTNPIAGETLTDGTISATFTSAINPATATNSTISLRGILGGTPRDLISGEFAEVDDEVIIPHQPQFNITDAFTMEMWVNPSRFPANVNVPIVKKGRNYKVELMPSGKLIVNETVMSSVPLQPFVWTHVTAVYDGTGAIQIYYNGSPVGSGVYNGITASAEDIKIASPVSGDSFIGLIDEVRIWTEARSVLEITTNQDKQLIGNEANLLAYYVFDNNAPEGEDGAQNEAIRDYTGNSIGTTQNGLSFVTGEEAAAPLDITRMVQDLQFTISASVGNTVLNIVPVFTNQELEGAQLTAMISNRKLEDPAGNLVEGRSWDFIINRNIIEWSQNNIRVEQIQGETTLIDTIDLVNEEGAIDVEYRFVGLPAWITVIDGADPEDINTIGSRQTNRDIEFEVAAFLNAGIHTANVNIETFNAETGERLGVETFLVEAEVTCAPPAYDDFNSNDYFGSMSFVGNLFIDGIQSLDNRDAIGVYLNDELRGTATVGNQGRVNLTVFGGFSDSGALRFRVWDASECSEYQGIIENYDFELDGRKGSSNAPVRFTVGQELTRRIPLVPGFQEISFNVRDNETTYDLSLRSLEGLNEGDEIIDRENTSMRAVVNTEGKIIGNIPAFDIRKAYVIRSTATTNTMLLVSGIQVAIGTDIAIEGDNVVNAIPFFPNELQRTRFALRSLTSTSVNEGDRIERRGLFAEYSAENGWKGSLTHLTPGLGYIYKAETNGTLNYSGIIGGIPSSVAGAAKTSEVSYTEKAAQIGWKVNVNDYPTFMYVNAILETELLDTDKSYVIAAFVGDDIRGIAKPELIDGEYHYYIGVGGDYSGDVSFKLYDGENIVELDNVEVYESDINLGDFNAPYELTYTKEATVETLATGYMLSQNAPNPLIDATRINFSVPQDTHVDISLYNVLGQKVYTFLAKEVKGNTIHTIDWNGVANNKVLTSGIYIYQLTADNQKLQRKLVIK